MSKVIFSFLTILTGFNLSAQVITNGNFNGGTTGWGCNPEVNTESVYGGSSVTNQVAEVDEAAGLCQTISGFTVGSYYRLSMVVSRRTTCGPTVQGMKITFSNNALNASVSRNGTNFALTTETFTFVATSTTQTLNFAATTAGTCNLLVDNVSLTLISALPVTLTSFSTMLQEDKTVAVNWATASENRNDHFTVDRSADGANWLLVEKVKGAQLSETVIDYTVKDENPLPGISYYRLSQTDLDGSVKILSMESVNNSKTLKALTAFPNPANSQVTVEGDLSGLGIYDATGKQINSVTVLSASESTADLDLSGLNAGVYLVRSNGGVCRLVKQ